MSQPVTVTEQAEQKYTNDITNGRHHMIADEPEDLGGADLGPTPFEYLCAALGSCTTITMRMYVDRKGWPVDQLSAEVSHSKKDVSGEMTDVFERHLTITGDISEEQRQRILAIANKCPVHRTLETSSHVVTDLR
ncbi:MAG: OsmC family protein [Lysobacterales bacterium]